jgi:hypothetical protein
MFAVYDAICLYNDHQQTQGQSLQACGLNYENICFSHEQLYVACLHVGKLFDLFVNIPEEQRILCITYMILHINKYHSIEYMNYWTLLDKTN